MAFAHPASWLCFPIAVKRQRSILAIADTCRLAIIRQIQPPKIILATSGGPEMQDLRAPVSDGQLRACIEAKQNPWPKTFDLLFRKNPSITASINCYSPIGFAQLNAVQQQFVGFDYWYGRYLNGGFAAPLFDPDCSVVAAYLAIPVLGWPEFERQLKVAIEGALDASEAQIRSVVEGSDVWSAGNYFVEASGLEAGIETSAQSEAIERFDSWYATPEQQAELDRRVLASIWNLRQDLIKPLH